MYAFVALAAFAVAGTAVHGLTVSSPASLTECQPVALTWSNGTSPYYVDIIPGGEVSASALENLGEVDSTTYTWTVNIAAGTSITVRVTDGTGVINYSSAVTIQSGASDSCLSSSASTSTSSTAAAAAAAVSSAVASGASTTTEASGSTTASASTTASSSTSSSAAFTAYGLNTGLLAVVAGAIGVNWL